MSTAAALPHQVFNSAQVKAMEQEYAAAHGGNCFELMLLAGQGAFERIGRFCPQAKLVWVFVGRGNNGGDGYVVASLLRRAGIACRVFATGRPHEHSEAFLACSQFLQDGGKVEYALPSREDRQPDVVVDALLGTGISSAPRSPVDEWILFINRTQTFTLSVDVPSGLNADTGECPGDCVRADVTVCMLALKPGLFTGEAVDYTGRVELADFGFDSARWFGRLQQIDKAPPLPLLQRTCEDIADDLPVRVPSSHKGDAGKVLIIGGAKDYAGAAIMCARAALRAGAGLVKVALDPANVSALNAACPEIMSVDFTDAKSMAAALEWADVIAAGPGLGQGALARELVVQTAGTGKDAVFDADALNILASLQLKPAGDRHILTPHPGEAARLLECSVAEINADRLQAAFGLQQRFGGVALLKGAGSVVCDGKRLTLIREGSPAMASGGMGDVLTGVAAAYMAEGLGPCTALICAACVHGRAGFLAGQQGGVIGTAATDLLPYIRQLTNRIGLH